MSRIQVSGLQVSGLAFIFACTILIAPATSFAALQNEDAPTADQTFKRVVEFRDGTILEVRIPDQTVPWKTVSTKGEITDQPVSFERIKRIDFVTNPVTEQVAAIRKLISELGSANYQTREAAQKRLIEIGDQYRDVIAVASGSEDSEVRWRIDDILGKLSAANESVQNDFDRIELSDSGETLDGDVGNWELIADFHGQPITLERSLVLAIYDGEVSLDFDGEASVAEIVPILEDDPAQFPANLIRLDFDTRPNGERLVPGQDVADAYVDVGATISTSIADSMVTVQQYKVRNGQSAATHAPPYTGTITVRFCVPGNPRLPASVRYIGCWASYISPEGTLLQAFDARDQLIGQVITTVTGAEFLSLKSTIPIAYCKITPVVDVDPDYAFDEFIFDPPRPLIESGDPALFSVVLKTGERLQGQQVVASGDQLQLIDLTIGVAELTIEKSDVAVLIPPSDHASTRDNDERSYVQLRDSSVLRAVHNDQEGLQLERLASNRRPDIGDIAAIWSVDAVISSVADAELDGGATLMHPDGPIQLENPSLGVNWIESASLADQADLDYTYANSPMVWLVQPAERTTSNGILRTVDGETYVLSENGFQLSSWDGENVALQWRDETFSIPLREVRTMRLPHIE